MIQEILRAAFVAEGRIFGVRGLVTLLLDSAVVYLAIAGDPIPEQLIWLALPANIFYFGERSTKLLPKLFSRRA